MIYDFLGISIVLPKVQAVLPLTYCWGNGWAGEAHVKLSLFFYGEQDYKDIRIPLIEGVECLYGKTLSENGELISEDCDVILDLSGKPMYTSVHPITDCAAAARILPVYNSFLTALSDFNNK